MQKFLRTSSLTATTILLAVAAAAQSPTNGLPDLFMCRAIENDLERVHCYDTVTDDLQIANEKGDIVTITKRQVEEMEKESFGFSLPSLPKLSSLFGKSQPASETETSKPSRRKSEQKKQDTGNKLASPIKSVQVFNYKQTRFYLENGQIWEQKGGRALNLRIRKDRPAVAHITRGSLSGYRLRVNGKGEMIVVRRVQ